MFIKTAFVSEDVLKINTARSSYIFMRLDFSFSYLKIITAGTEDDSVNLNVLSFSSESNVYQLLLFPQYVKKRDQRFMMMVPLKGQLRNTFRFPWLHSSTSNICLVIFKIQCWCDKRTNCVHRLGLNLIKRWLILKLKYRSSWPRMTCGRQKKTHRFSVCYLIAIVRRPYGVAG